MNKRTNEQLTETIEQPDALVAAIAAQVLRVSALQDEKASLPGQFAIGAGSGSAEQIVAAQLALDSIDLRLGSERMALAKLRLEQAEQQTLLIRSQQTAVGEKILISEQRLAEVQSEHKELLEQAYGLESERFENSETIREQKRILVELSHLMTTQGGKTVRLAATAFGASH